MPFAAPVFNLDVNIWHWPSVVTAAPDVEVMGNLTPGRRVMVAGDVPTASTATAVDAWLKSRWIEMQLLLPMRTDIRPHTGPVAGVYKGDAVEVPALSGRFYICTGVDDVGRGFPNEHRMAILIPAYDSVRGSTSNPWAIPSPVVPIP